MVLNKRFGEKGLAASIVLGFAGSACLGQMFRWAGLPVRA
jgi:hypothetical protein